MLGLDDGLPLLVHFGPLRRSNMEGQSVLVFEEGKYLVEDVKGKNGPDRVAVAALARVAAGEGERVDVVRVVEEAGDELEVEDGEWLRFWSRFESVLVTSFAVVVVDEFTKEHFFFFHRRVNCI